MSIGPARSRRPEGVSVACEFPARSLRSATRGTPCANTGVRVRFQSFLLGRPHRHLRTRDKSPAPVNHCEQPPQQSPGYPEPGTPAIWSFSHTMTGGFATALPMVVGASGTMRP
jgi:hypothetical protein